MSETHNPRKTIISTLFLNMQRALLACLRAMERTKGRDKELATEQTTKLLLMARVVA